MRSGPWPVLLVLSCAVQGYLGGAQRRQDGHTKGETWGTRMQGKNATLKNPSLVLAPPTPPLYRLLAKAGSATYTEKKD